MMWLVDVSIRRAVFAVMLITALISLGWISLGRLGVDFFPEMELPYVSVTTTLQGASPETIETEITDIIEDSLSTIDGIETMQSFSSEGRSRVVIEFLLEADINVKTQDVRDKIQLALSDLPQGVEPPVVDKVDPDAAPIVSIIIAGDISIREITAFAEEVAKKELQRISGVGSVSIVGGQERAIRIWLDNNKMRAYQVSADDVRKAIQTEHAELPGGRVEINGGVQEFGVKTLAEVKQPTEFALLPVAYRPNGITIKVGDVAEVEDGTQDERSAAYLNGRRGVALDVRKQSGRNTVEVAHAIKAQVETLRELAPEGTEIIVTRDNAKFVESSIHDVAKDIQIVIGLVTFVCFVFLLNVRATLIVAMAIPTSLIATFFVFYIFGFTINIVTLLALTIAIGLLVDDAIVVVEAITRELEAGKPPMQAAFDGTKKVALAVLAGTIATLAVFVPIAFMSGMIGRFFFQYGLAIVFSVSVSWVVAMTLTPMLASRFLTSGKTAKWLRPIEAMWDTVDRSYALIVSKAIQLRYIVILIAIGSLSAGGWYATHVASGFLSKTDRSEFIGTVELPVGTGIQTATTAADRIERALNPISNVENVFITIGGEAQGDANVLDLYVGLTPKKTRKQSQFTIMDQAREALLTAVPGAVKISVSDVPLVTGTISGGAEIDIILKGPDLNVVNTYAEELVRLMRHSPSFADTRTTYTAGRPEAQFVFDRVKAGDQAISATTLALTSRIALGGFDAASFEDSGQRYDVRIRLKEEQRQSISDMKLVQVRSQNGELVDLASVTRVQFASGPSQIQRQNRSRKISVVTNTSTGTALGDATDAIEAILAKTPPPKGVSYEIGGYADIMRDTVSSIILALIMALIALYMVLASQFNSFVQPLIIMVTAPLSFSGAFAALYYFGFESSMFAQIGLIGLMGIVMKNGILLVDRANQLIADGRSGRDAIAQACPDRLRPVLMTAISAIFGMIPVVLATSDAAEFRNPLGALLIGGLTSSTILTLLVIPAAFMIPYDIKQFVRWVFKLSKQTMAQVIRRFRSAGT